MSTMTATARRTPPLFTEGQRFALRTAAGVIALFLISFSYGQTERNMFIDIAVVVVFVWQLVTSPWTYFAVAAVWIVWTSRAALTRPPSRHRPNPTLTAYAARHRAARRG